MYFFQKKNIIITIITQYFAKRLIGFVYRLKRIENVLNVNSVNLTFDSNLITCF